MTLYYSWYWQGSYVMGRDDSWPFPFLSVKLCIQWCTHVHDECLDWCLFPLIHSLGQLPISVWMGKCQSGNTQNGGTVLPIVNLMADSKSGSPDSYSSFLVTIRLSLLVSGIFACDRQMDNADHYYSLPPHCGGAANKWSCSILVHFWLSSRLVYCQR